MFSNDLESAQFAATRRSFFNSSKQKIWAGVFRCAYLRWKESGFTSVGEFATIQASLALGDQFWDLFL